MPIACKSLQNIAKYIYTKMNVCKWCKKKFSSQGVLKRHQITTKYCLKLRGKIDNRYICKWCDTMFSTSYNLRVHEERYHVKIISIKTKYKEKIDILKKTIIDLEKQLENKKGYVTGMVDGIQIAPVKKVINNTGVKNTYVNPKLLSIKTDNIRPLTSKTIREDLNEGKYTKKMFLRGVSGLVEFISNMITHQAEDGTIERNYACTDSSRYRFHRLIESKEWREDNGAHYVNTIIDEVKEPAKEYFTELVDKRRDVHRKEDKYQLEYYDDLIKNTRLVYKGSQNPNGKYHDALFRKVRGQINGVAFI